MYSVLRGFILSIAILWLCLHNPSYAGKRMVQSIIVQRPVVDYINNSLVRIINITSLRYSRRDPQYYMNVYIQNYVVFNKQLNIHTSLDELQGYTSKQRFLDLDLNLCEFLDVTRIKVLYKKTSTEEYGQIRAIDDCIIPIGFNYFYNITWPKVSPVTFFFTEGRLSMKFTDKGRGNVVVGSAHLDISLKFAAASNS